MQTKDQTADIFTKALTGVIFEKHRSEVLERGGRHLLRSLKIISVSDVDSLWLF